MYQTLLHLYATYHNLGYVLICFFAILEGPIISIMLGSIIKLGYLRWDLVYIAVMLGDVIGDTFLYYLGYRYGDSAIEKVNRKTRITPAHIEKVKALFHKHSYLILFTSKVTNGFGFSLVVLLTAGIMRIPFLVYLGVNLVAQLIWSGVLLLLGYHFVGIYQQIDSVTGKAWYLVLLVLVAGVVYALRREKKGEPPA
jgi:membrane protein DedA with SNARE-associated domain